MDQTITSQIYRIMTLRKIPINHQSEGSKYVDMHHYICGNDVPIFDVDNVHAFNQIVGFMKFLNRENYNVYSRGECELYPTLLPSLMRRKNNNAKTSSSSSKPNYSTLTYSNPHRMSAKVSKLIDNVKNDNRLKKSLKLDGKHDDEKIEGLLQHYGISTRYIDAVDNHWIALWMGLNKFKKFGPAKSYGHYERREIPLVESATGIMITDKDLYLYVILLAVPKQLNISLDGITISKDFVETDLRKALPSTFLRPHAQHGIVLRKIPHTLNSGADYDMATQVVCILRVRIDRANSWIGDGGLLCQDALFPSPAHDSGYHILLSRDDIFKEKDFSITKYY